MKNFYKHFFAIFTTGLLSGSLIMFVGTMFVNFGNYFFHLIMGRMLGPDGYGVLQGVISTMYLLGILSMALNLIIMRYTAKYHNDFDKREAFFYWITSKILIFSLLLTLCLAFLVPLWGNFLKIHDYITLLIALLFLPVSLLLTTGRSSLQGDMKFIKFSINNNLEVITKIGLAVGLVFFGFGVRGVMIAIVSASFIAYLFSLKQLNFHPLRKKVSTAIIEKKEFILYAIPTLFSMLVFTSLYTTDILMVKHYFSNFDAGIYASLSILGKIIFFASFPLTSTMFPMISRKHAKGEVFSKIFLLTILLVVILNLILLTIYYFFPREVIILLFGKKYISGSYLVFSFAIFLGLYSLSNTFNSFYLSIGKTVSSYLSLVFAILQIVLISMFHNSLKQVIDMNIIVTFILLASLVIYYPYATKKR